MNDHHLLEPDDTEKSILLKTIRFPKNHKKIRTEFIELPNKNY